MGFVKGEVEEERSVLVGLDEADGLVGEMVAKFLVLPSRGLAAGHEADAADAVDDGVAVLGIGLDLEQFRVVATGGFAADFFP